MLLVLDAAGTDCDIGYQVGQEVVILRIEHLVGTGEAEFVHCADVHPADGHEPLEDIRIGDRIGLMEHALVSSSGSAGLVGIDTGDDDDLVLDLVLDGTQASYVVEHRILPVCGTRADNKYQLVGLTAQNVTDLLVIKFLGFQPLVRGRIHFLYFLGVEKLPLENHVHMLLPIKI